MKDIEGARQSAQGTKILRCRILVVGAGPAGASAAAAAARRGLDVLVVERKTRVGVPVRCAEYIPAPLLGQIDPRRGFVVQSVRGMKTFLEGREVRETSAPGYIIRRDLFDQALALEAERAGAKLLLSTRVLSRHGESVSARDGDGAGIKIEAQVVIGADGPHSVVGGWIDSRNRNLMPALQVSVPLPAPMDHTEVYFHKEIYGGYGWLFPKGDTANVGLGMKKGKGGAGSIRRVLERFVNQLARAGKIEERILGRTAGWIPAEPPRKVVEGRILLAGDAAGQTNSITGAGVAQAVICGRMAGEAAAKAVQGGNPDLLSEYETRWRDLYEDTLSRAFERRQLLEREWDRLHEIIKHCWIAFREYYERP